MGKKRRKLVANEAANETMVIVSAGSVLSERYELVKELGRGGMGIVYEAKDKELHDKQVAVKVLPPEMSTSKAAIKRLKKEAIAAMELTHENVMRLHSFETDDNTAYLVLEYIDGEPLDERLVDEERLSYEETLEVMRGAVAGLSAAHRQGIIHRDIKPANLMYKTVGGEKVVRITDFGIAYVIKDSMTRLTGTESAGTLSYIAPEQLKGTRANAKTDQYSLAATAYELLSGEPPFVGAGLSHQILHAEPHLIDDVPDCANKALQKALAKDPDERFEDLNAFFKAFAGNAVIMPPVAATEEEPEAPEEAKEPTEEKPKEEAEVAEPESGALPKTGIALLLLLLAGALVTSAFFLDGSDFWTKRVKKEKPKDEVPSYAPDRKHVKRAYRGKKLILQSNPSNLKVYDDNGQYLGRTPLPIKRPRRTHLLTYVVNSDLKIKSALPVVPKGRRAIMLDVPTFLLAKAEAEMKKGDKQAATRTIISAAQNFYDNEDVVRVFTDIANNRPRRLENIGFEWLPSKPSTKDIEVAKNFAALGVASAQSALAQAYESGNSVALNKTKALDLYKSAAARGNSEAAYKAGVFYRDGIGTKSDYHKAFEYLKKAASLEHKPALFALGKMYERGMGVTRSKADAVRCYRQAANSGNVEAMLTMGNLNFHASGVALNYKEAVSWYQRAADKDSADAQYALAWCYEQGLGVFKDKMKALYWYERATKLGHERARKQLGILRDSEAKSTVSKGSEAKFQRLLDAANKGDVRAQYAVGTAYLNGKHGVQANRREAKRWLEKSAASGNRAAQRILQTRFGRRRPIKGPGFARPKAPSRLRLGR